MQILGVDFTSRPSRRKPITIALGTLDGDTVAVRDVVRCPDFAAFDAMLRTPGPWVGAFDFPFGLPRALVDALKWPGAGSLARDAWPALVRHYATFDRAEVTRLFDAFRAARPVGAKYAHRATEALAGAHSAMKLVNPPVAWMLHEGAPRLLAAGVHLPGIRDGDSSRVAVEAYPGGLMRSIARRWGVARTPPYKSDAPGRRTPAQREVRVRLLWGLVEGEHPLGLRLDLPVGLAGAAADDGTGDTLDAIAAAVQAAWCAQRASAAYGMPERLDPLEGWIATAGAADDPRPAPAIRPDASVAGAASRDAIDRKIR